MASDVVRQEVTKVEGMPPGWPAALDALVAPRPAGEPGVYPGEVLDLLRWLRENGLKVDFAVPPEGFRTQRGGQYVTPALVFSPHSLVGGAEVVTLALHQAISEPKLKRTRLDIGLYVFDGGEARVVYEAAGPAFPVLVTMRTAVRGWRSSRRTA